MGKGKKKQATPAKEKPGREDTRTDATADNDSEEVHYMTLRNRTVMTPKKRESAPHEVVEGDDQNETQEEEDHNVAPAENDTEEVHYMTLRNRAITTPKKRESAPHEDIPTVVEGNESQEEEEVYMQLRQRTVMSPSKHEKSKKKSDEDEVQGEQDVEEEVEEVTAGSKGHGMTLRNGKLTTPLQKNKTKRIPAQSPVEEAERAVISALEKRSQTLAPKRETVKRDIKPPTKKPKEERKSHCCFDCLTISCFVVFGLLAIATGTYGFYAVKGEPIVLSNLLDFDLILPSDYADPVKSTVYRFDSYLRSLGAQIQVVAASTIFFVCCGVCGLCWLARFALRVAEENARIDPVTQLERLLNWRRKVVAGRKEVCDKLDSGKQTQEERVKCLKRLQQYDSQLQIVEEKISYMWVEYGDEILSEC